jgi:hypothetical protein
MSAERQTAIPWYLDARTFSGESRNHNGEGPQSHRGSKKSPLTKTQPLYAPLSLSARFSRVQDVSVTGFGVAEVDLLIEEFGAEPGL